jgi:hypothetical protein
LGVHFNYSNKQVNQDEKYQGIQWQAKCTVGVERDHSVIVLRQ